MTPSNMSIVFGPTLLAPAVFSLESSLNSTFVSQTVESMIEVRCMSEWLAARPFANGGTHATQHHDVVFSSSK